MSAAIVRAVYQMLDAGQSPEQIAAAFKGVTPGLRFRITPEIVGSLARQRGNGLTADEASLSPNAVRPQNNKKRRRTGPVA